ncbi:hypothetical protein GLE_1610 [Lysobacter enzymogenes]|uniref:Uncharacterized protein n=1 Tax=Lysobacter enzymogenes TaxID=69 RepID=A0A0S2DEG4_LYSEN|nr:hypothetical protein GLE_1610 [Lysobacter enzymogenes]
MRHIDNGESSSNVNMGSGFRRNDGRGVAYPTVRAARAATAATHLRRNFRNRRDGAVAACAAPTGGVPR